MEIMVSVYLLRFAQILYFLLYLHSIPRTNPMSIRITYTSWEEQDNFQVETGRYSTLTEFV